MNEIVNVYREKLPEMKFVGKKYNDYSHWGEWFENGWFDMLEEKMGGVEKIKKVWKDGGGYIGMEFKKEGKLLEYWIGMFVPVEMVVPEGFSSMEIKGKTLGVCWIYGKEDEVHDTSKCSNEIARNGMSCEKNSDGVIVSFENCVCPRFTIPDEKENVILDYCFFVE